MSQSTMFDATTINGLTLKNRFVRSATYLGMAGPDGSCTQRIHDNAVELAEGDVGLIITGYAYIDPVCQSVPLQLGIYADEQIPSLAAMTNAVHQAGGRIAMQVMHGGLFSSPELTGQVGMGPSVMNTENGPMGKEMTVQDIRATVDAFGQGAARAKEAGFDGVQIHAAHGYLLNQFLSPFYNHRQDEYGGSIENRARILLDTVDTVREAVGAEYPVLVKLNSDDLLPGGFGVDEMVQVAGMLEKAGVDAIEISGGTIMSLVAGNANASPMKAGKHPIYYKEAAKRYKAAVGTPLMLVGGSRCLPESQQLVAEGTTDYVAMCRPLIREPGLIKRWQSGDTRDSECISDNLCVFETLKGTGVRCVQLGT